MLGCAVLHKVTRRASQSPFPAFSRTSLNKPPCKTKAACLSPPEAHCLTMCIRASTRLAKTGLKKLLAQAGAAYQAEESPAAQPVGLLLAEARAFDGNQPLHSSGAQNVGTISMHGSLTACPFRSCLQRWGLLKGAERTSTFSLMPSSMHAPEPAWLRAMVSCTVAHRHVSAALLRPVA